MLRKLALIALVPLLAAASPALAVTAKEKQETCKVGADSQQLTGRQAQRVHQEVHGQGQFRAAGTQSREEASAEEAEETRRHGRPTATSAAGRRAPPPPKQ